MSNLDPVVQIGDWYYQVIYGQLWPANASINTEQMVRLEPRLHSLLNFFLLHPNTLLAKDTLIEKVWPADEGTDAAVMRAVGALRKVLGDDVRAPNYIATVSKKGYCWLAQIQTAPLFDRTALQPLDTELNTGLTDSDDAATSTWSWRYIVATVSAVLISCASLAYILASYTATPLVKLPDTILPISALSGQEYWPVLNTEQNKVVYQHRAPDSNGLNWSIQSLADLKVEHLPQRYLQLSQALWQDNQHIVFRASTAAEGCYFYRQQLEPLIAPTTKLWRCQSVLSQGLARWNKQWLWLDAGAGQQIQLWSTADDGNARLLQQIANEWHSLEYILVSDDTLYLLAQETQNNSALFKLTLPGGKPELVKRFNYVVNQFSWWDDTHLLLAPENQQLQILGLSDDSSQELGPLTRELTQALRYPGQVLATQYLDYTTDIFKVADDAAFPGKTTLQPWHVSNRSERLLAIAHGQAAFVSERAGHSQIWLEQGRDSTQLSRLDERQQVQQLLWHQQHLLVLSNSQLYTLDPLTAEMALYPIQPARPGRYASCHDRLYWTELTSNGWQLFEQRGQDKHVLQKQVVDVRCGPAQSVLLQFVQDARVALLSTAGTLTELPIEIDWRRLTAEQWFTDSSGVYWLDASGTALKRYHWHNGLMDTKTLPQPTVPVAIYSGGKGLGYIVYPRPYDSDIVWLQNRR
jgi:DNA-binding winged helix-turn-helix (wHTH) protein